MPANALQGTCQCLFCFVRIFLFLYKTPGNAVRQQQGCGTPLEYTAPFCQTLESLIRAFLSYNNNIIDDAITKEALNRTRELSGNQLPELDKVT